MPWLPGQCSDGDGLLSRRGLWCQQTGTPMAEQLRPPFPHHLLDDAPFARTRTGCSRCDAEELVRRRGSGSPSRKWCASGLGSDTQATHRDRSRTTCSTTHPLLVLAPDAAGAAPRNWCGAEELVRRRGTGAASRNWCAVEELVRRRRSAAESVRRRGNVRRRRRRLEGTGVRRGGQETRSGRRPSARAIRLSTTDSANSSSACPGRDTSRARMARSMLTSPETPSRPKSRPGSSPTSSATPRRSRSAITRIS